MLGCLVTAAGHTSLLERAGFKEHCIATIESMVDRIVMDTKAWHTLSPKGESATPVSPEQDRALKICGSIAGLQDLARKHKP